MTPPQSAASVTDTKDHAICNIRRRLYQVVEISVKEMQDSMQAARADDLVRMREALKVATTNAEQATKHAMHLEAENMALRDRVAELEARVRGPKTFKHIAVKR